MKPIFGVDVDGILLDMDEEFRNYITRTLGVDPGQPARQWGLHTGYGIPKADEDRMWDVIWATPLKPMPEAHRFLDALRERGFNIIAISNRRKGPAQAALWRDIGQFQQLEGVIATDGAEEKAAYAEMLGLRGFVDDKLENCWAVAEGLRRFADRHDDYPVSPVWLLDRPYNQSLDLRVPYKRVKSLMEVLENV